MNCRNYYLLTTLLIWISLCEDFLFSKKTEKITPDNISKIPNSFHFVMVYLHPAGATPLTFTHMLSIISAAAVNKPDALYLHTNVEPFGKWWECIRPLVTLRFINELPKSWGSKNIIHGAHVSDHIRLHILLEEGGVYLDADIISLRPLRTLWAEERGDINVDGKVTPIETIMGKQKDNGLCNAVIIAAPNATFLNIWREEYEGAFNPDGWAEASVFLPLALSLRNPETIKVMPESAFFFPSYTHHNFIFEDENIDISEDTYAYHLWSAPQLSSYEEVNHIWPLRNPPRNLFEKMIRFLALNTYLWNKTMQECI